VSLALLFVLASFAGWSVFNLQLVSLIRLLESAGIEFLPRLLCVQAVGSWLLLRLWGSAAQGSTRLFLFTALTGGLVVASLGHPLVIERLGAYVPITNWYFGGVFILSQLIISALRLGIHLIFSRRVSVLGNPQVSTQLSIAEESGFLIGALSLFAARSYGAGWGQLGLVTFPFLAALGVFSVLGQERTPLLKVVQNIADFKNLRKFYPWFRPTAPTAEAKPAPVRGPVRRPVFFSRLIALFFVVASLKSLQWFGMAYGLSEASRSGGKLLELVSRLALIQSTLTLVILVASLRFASRIPTWGLGFRVLLGAQGLVAIGLALAPLPYFLMAGEVIRKVLEHGFLARSLQLLTSTLPEEHRFESRQAMERWSTTTGTAIAGVLALVTVEGYLPLGWLWALVLGFACVGLVLRRRLFDTLCEFHVARLRQNKLGGVLQACHVLSNPECRHHHAALTSLLERSPRPIIRKTILLALGGMRHPPLVPAILAHVAADREDIQLAAVRALQEYHGHEINFILLRTLREMVRSQQSVRLTVIRSITERLGRLVVPYLVEVLEGKPNERVTANAVEILAEVAHAERDEDLRDYLARFLDASHPRRVRANAVVALYRHREHGPRALEAFDRFMTSEDEKELDAAAYIAGVLNLQGHESFLWERSVGLAHENITLLVALLRLREPVASGELARHVTGENELKAREALVRMSVLPFATRIRVFYQILEAHPQALDRTLLRMRASQRDFERDRELMRQEALRIGLQLVEEEAWGATTADPAKAA
jgi:hypothetical protein